MTVASVSTAAHDDEPARMTFGDGTLFAESYTGQSITLVDPAQNFVQSVIRAPQEDCCWPAFGAGSLWLLEYSTSSGPPDRLVRMDPSGGVIATLPLASAGGLVFGAGSVWGSSDGKVFRLDPNTNQITARVPTTAVPIAFGAGSVWAVGDYGTKIVRIDPASNTVAADVHVPGLVSVLTASDSAVWAAEGPSDRPGSHLWKINPATNRVVGQVKLGHSSALDDLAVGDDGSVWVSLFDADLVLRVRPS